MNVKTIIGLIIVFLFSFSSVIAQDNAATCNSGQAIGDVNSDNVIDDNDVTIATDIWSKNIAEPSDICCIDINKDGAFGDFDLLDIIDIAAGSQNSPGKCPIICNPGQSLGDINDDGLINNDDVNLAVDIWAGKLDKPSDISCIDTNNDGEFGDFDLLDIIDMAALTSGDGSVTCNSGQAIGDVNGDGQITDEDFNLVSKIWAGDIAKPSDICCIDINQNGEVDDFDVLDIIDIVAGSKTSPGTCIECTDSDGGKDYYGGKNYYVKGTVTENDNDYTDFCEDGRKIREYFCSDKDINSDGTIIHTDSIRYDCPNGCQDGACIEEKGCTDSDNSIPNIINSNDRLIRGETTGSWLGKYGIKTDACGVDGRLNEYVCRDDGTIGVQSNYCPEGEVCSVGICVEDSLKSDLIISSASVSVSDKVYMDFTIKNIGGGDAVSFMTEKYKIIGVWGKINGKDLGWTQVPTGSDGVLLKPNEEMKVKWEANTDNLIKGNNKLSLFVDRTYQDESVHYLPNGYIDESDEDNNLYLTDFYYNGNTQECTDSDGGSDGGRNLNLRGTTTLAEKHSDYCRGNTLVEYSCGGGRNIQKNDFFIITANGNDVELQYKGSDKCSADAPIAKFKNVETGESIERSMRSDGSFSLKINGETFDFQNIYCSRDSPIKLHNQEFIEGEMIGCPSGCSNGACLKDFKCDSVKLELRKKETISSVKYILGNKDLPDLLRRGWISNRAAYSQKLFFNNKNSGYVDYLENQDDIAGNFLYFRSGGQIAAYALEFDNYFTSGINSSDLIDFESEKITILGKAYTIVQAKRISSGEDIKLTLIGGAIKDTLLEGETKTYTLDGRNYEIILDFVSSAGSKFTINGEATRLLGKGYLDKLSDGTSIAVSEISYGDYAGGIRQATFFFGADKLEFRDMNIADDLSSNELKVNDETINGAKVKIKGIGSDNVIRIKEISVEMSANDDYYVPVGGVLSKNKELDEPELLFTKNWDIRFNSYDETKGIATIEIGKYCPSSDNIKCYSNADCPSVTRRYCSSSSACSESKSYTCVNPGTVNSYCKSFGGGGGCRYCANGCSNGACIDSPGAIYVKLGEKFSLSEKDSAKVTDYNYMKITLSRINNIQCIKAPCPQGVQVQVEMPCNTLSECDEETGICTTCANTATLLDLREGQSREVFGAKLTLIGIEAANINTGKQYAIFVVQKSYSKGGVDVEIFPSERTIKYGEEARYKVKVTDKHIVATNCPGYVGGVCPTQEPLIYQINIKNLPFMKKFPKEVEIPYGGSRTFELVVKPYEVAEEESIEKRTTIVGNVVKEVAKNQIISKPVKITETATTTASRGGGAGVSTDTAIKRERAEEKIEIIRPVTNLMRMYKFTVTASLRDNYRVQDTATAVLAIKPGVTPPKPPPFPGEKVSIKLHKGWNLISLPGKLIKFDKRGLERNQKLIGFVYIKEEQKYYNLQEAERRLGGRLREYLAKNAFWIYTKSPMKLNIWVDRKLSYEDLHLVKGWNLAPITEDMLGGYLADVLGDCNLEKINLWNAKNQRWEKISIRYTFSDWQFGYGFAVKSKDYCKLAGPDIIAPPPMPE